MPSTSVVPFIFINQSKGIEQFQEDFVGEMADGDGWWILSFFFLNGRSKISQKGDDNTYRQFWGLSVGRTETSETSQNLSTAFQRHLDEKEKLSVKIEHVIA